MDNKGTYDPQISLNKSERKDASRRSAPKAAVVYEAIRHEGQEELTRTTSALIWSGVAAGLSMGFSFLMESLLVYYLPEARWTPLISKFGYCIGFLIVVLGRQQLFTENTLTPILQLLTQWDFSTLKQVARLWVAVLFANLAGALLFATMLYFLGLYSSEMRAPLEQIGQFVFVYGFGKTLFRAIFAGWLIALMVWLLPFAETGRITVIIIITYVVGLGGFAHVVAGSVNAFYMVIAHSATPIHFLLKFFLPALLGNVIGGVAFVAFINHAQVRLGHFKKDNGT